MERTLVGELSHHLGYAPGEPKPEAQPNHRNGTTLFGDRFVPET